MLNTGTRVGPYEILAKAGAGGMGEVYRARDTRLDRIVALKVLPPHLADRDDLRQRFQIEARAVARLQHPNICAVFDVGEEHGLNYLILEYLEGETLEKHLATGPLPIVDAVRIGAQIAAGLDAAHRAGITHRDLKPGNVMLTKSGAKLLDFGLAKMEQRAASSDSATVVTATQALTAEGSIMGTFQYMAPEQLEGAEADARTDIFALGHVLYEMLTGRKAFQGKSQAMLISSIMSADPAPLTTLQPGTPPALERAILRCLVKDPDERWQTARDLCRELEWIALGGSQAGVAAPVVDNSKTRRKTLLLPWAIAIVALLAVSILSWLYLRRPAQATMPVARFTIPLPQAPGFIAGPMLSPNGAMAALWLGDGNNWQIYLYTLATGEFHPLRNSVRCIAGAWSPDSRYFLANAVEGGELRKIDIASGTVSILAKPKVSAMVGWSSAGVIVYQDGDTLYRIPAEGGAPQKVTTLPKNARPPLQFLPDNDHFLIAVIDGQNIETRAYSLQDGEPRIVLPPQSSPAVYTASGYLLFLQGQALVAQSFDLRKLAPSGAKTTLAPAVSIAGRRMFGVSDTGILMFHRATASGGQQLTWYDRAGKRIGTLGSVDQYSNPAISPDGKRLAVGIGEVLAKQRDIWIYDLVRGGGYRLTFDPADDVNPVWSPDGRYIAFASDRKGKRDIYRKLASGTGDDELLFSTGNDDKVPDSWSPDGQSIWVTVQNAKTRNDIYQLSLGDRKLTSYIATPLNDDKATLSPDGRWLAYHIQESGRDEIYIQPYPATGERWQVSTQGGTEPFWRADGKELFFLSGNMITAVDIKAAGKSLEIGVPHALFEVKVSPNATRNRYVPAPDGQKFLVLWQQEQPTTGIDTILNWPELVKSK